MSSTASVVSSRSVHTPPAIAQLQSRSTVTGLDISADHQPARAGDADDVEEAQPVGITSARGHPPTTVPRARPPCVRQEHPVPTGAELVSAQVRTVVAQYPPIVDGIGVWYTG